MRSHVICCKLGLTFLMTSSLCLVMYVFALWSPGSLTARALHSDPLNPRPLLAAYKVALVATSPDTVDLAAYKVAPVATSPDTVDLAAYKVAPVATSPDTVDLAAYKRALQARASKDNVIILALFDSAFLDMTLNFYETSIQAFGITNFLLIASDVRACASLAARDLPCHVYMADVDAEKATVYGSEDFKRKMNIRTYMILDALQMGFSVLHTDVDIFFFKDPLRYISCRAPACDLAALWDSGTHNAGFLLVHPTEASQAVYAHMEETARHTKLDDQTALRMAIAAVTNSSHGLRIQVLAEDQFLSGVSYFENVERRFAGEHPCETCVVVHNNWIVSREAKTYRFMEMSLWLYDGHHRYFSSETRRYLTYSAPAVSSNASRWEWAWELDALKSALAIGQILNRTVILPRFHCDSQPKPPTCILIHHIKLTAFDQQFEGKYRASTFLSHPKVPEAVRASQSQSLYRIDSNSSAAILGSDHKDPDEVHVVTPRDRQKGASSTEIVDWFGGVSSSVLRFHSLYGAFGSFVDEDTGRIFEEKFNKAKKKGSYRQLE